MEIQENGKWGNQYILIQKGRSRKNDLQLLEYKITLNHISLMKLRDTLFTRE